MYPRAACFALTALLVSSGVAARVADEVPQRASAPAVADLPTFSRVLLLEQSAETSATSTRTAGPT